MTSNKIELMENKKDLQKLALDELRKEYGLSDNNDAVARASCTLSMQCAYHTVSCTSAKGDCVTETKDLVINGETVDHVTVAIICDGQAYRCK